MKNQRENSKVGRQTSFKKEYVEQAHKLCLLGATDKELADFFGVAVSTINLWKIKQPEFSESTKRGKIIADSKVAESLYKRACGFQYTEVKKKEVPSQEVDENGEIVDGKLAVVEITTTTKEVPPDTGAAFIWLKNRRPQNWRDKQEINHTHALDKEFIDTIEENFLSKMREAHERQKQVLAERGIDMENLKNERH